MPTIQAALAESATGAASRVLTPRCRCGSGSFSVVYKAPLYVKVVEGEVVAVEVARDCHEGAIIADCDRCGRSDIDGEDAGCIGARELADATAPWSAPAGR